MNIKSKAIRIKLTAAFVSSVVVFTTLASAGERAPKKDYVVLTNDKKVIVTEMTEKEARISNNYEIVSVDTEVVATAKDDFIGKKVKKEIIKKGDCEWNIKAIKADKVKKINQLKMLK